MDITRFISKNGVLVSDDDRAFDAEIEAALIKDGAATFEEKFRFGCNIAYQKTQKYKVLTTKQDADIDEYIRSVRGIVTEIDDDFEKVMKDEGLQDLLGKCRIIKINFETKTTTNGRNCDDCEC